MMPALEAAMKGALKGEKRQFTLSAKHDPDLQLDVTRLAPKRSTRSRFGLAR